MKEGLGQAKLEFYRRLSRSISFGCGLNPFLERLLDIMVSVLAAREIAVALAEVEDKGLLVRLSRGWCPEAAAKVLAGLETDQIFDNAPAGRPFYVLRCPGRPLVATPPATPAPDRQAVRLLGAPIGQGREPLGLLLADRLFGDEVEPGEDLAFLAELAELVGQFLVLDQEMRQAAAVHPDNSGSPLPRPPLGQLALAGQSRAIRQARNLLEQVAPSRAPVLLLGETGVGKRTAAQFIHQHSGRVGGELIRTNCAAWPEDRLEAALFGCEPGACPVMAGPLTGSLELAHRGTIYMESIELLSLPLQAKLLRLLQDGELERLGGTRPRPAEVRVVAGCQCDLKSEVDRFRFREDLYYRLNVFPVHLPALRERVEDIPLLLDHLLDILAEDLGRCLRLTPRAMERLCAYHWPGNLRELANLLERIALLADDERVDLPELTAFLAPRPERPATDLAGHSLSRLEEIERREVVAALERHNWVQSHAARDLGLTLRQIGYRIKKYGLKKAATKSLGRAPSHPRLPLHARHPAPR